MKKILNLVAAVLICTSVASAQQTIVPASKSLLYGKITPDHFQSKVTMKDSTGKILREYIKTEDIVIDKANAQLLRIQSKDYGQGRIILDSTVAELGSLKPIRMSMTTTPFFRTMRLNFGTNEVDAWDRAGNKAQVNVHHKMEVPYFDSNLYEWMINYLPYKSGYTATINTYTFEKGGLDVYKITNVSSEELVKDGKKIGCWKVMIKGDDQIESLYWINRTNYHSELVRYKFPDGRTLTVDRLK